MSATVSVTVSEIPSRPLTTKVSFRLVSHESLTERDLRIRLVRTGRMSLGSPYLSAGLADRFHATRFRRCERSLIAASRTPASRCVSSIVRSAPRSAGQPRRRARCARPELIEDARRQGWSRLSPSFRTRDPLLRRTLRSSPEPAESQVTDGPDASRVIVIGHEWRDGVARTWHAHGSRISRCELSAARSSVVVGAGHPSGGSLLSGRSRSAALLYSCAHLCVQKATPPAPPTLR